MLSQKLKSALFTTVAACAMVLGAGMNPANAFGIENAWNLNLSVANGVMHSGGGSFAGLTDITGIDHLVLNGRSIVTQTVSGGNAIGNPFSDSGYLNIIGAQSEGGGPFDFTFFHVFGTGAQQLYYTFTGLTGTLNMDESITFDPLSGTIKLWLESDADNNPITGDVLELAEFDIVAPSGGSDLNFFGGAGANATIDVTLQQVSGLAGLYTDMNGMEFNMDPFTLHLGNFNALLDPNVSPNPDNTGINAMGNGESIITLQNSGQNNILTIPEPSSMAALGFGLLGLMGMTARRRRTLA